MNLPYSDNLNIGYLSRLFDRQEKENDLAAEAADAKRREQEALAELEKA